MNKLFLLILGLFVSCSSTKKSPTKTWSLDQVALHPESIYFNQSSDRLFVSSTDGVATKNSGKGYITILQKNGQIIEKNLIKGLDAPKGMIAFRNKLYVTDIDIVYVIDIDTAKVLKKYTIPKAMYLSDIALDGYDIYVSDTLTSKVHLIKDDNISTFISGPSYDSPNGLLIKKGKLLVASWGLTTDWSSKNKGHLYEVDLKTKKRKNITKIPLGNLNGLELDEDSNYIVSDLVAHKVYQVSPKGQVKLLFSSKDEFADIGYLPSSRTLIVPNMLNDKLKSIKTLR